MNCPTELELAILADGALDAAAATRVAAHAASCDRCRTLLDALRAEVACLSAALAREDEHVAVPAFAQPVSHGAIARAGCLALGAAACVTAGPALAALAFLPRFAWLEAVLYRLHLFTVGNLTDLVVRSIVYLARSGGNVMSSIIETAVAAVFVGLVAWIAIARGRRGAVPLALAALAIAVVLSPTPSHALEIRQADDGAVVVAASETIDDTLIALGDTVEIDGTIEGDLIALGRLVEIRGRVGGLLITAAQTVRVDGDVDGTVIGAAQTLNVSPSQIGGNLFAFANTVNTSQSTRIAHNAVVFAQAANLAGPVTRDVLGFGTQVDIGNAIGGNLTTFSSNVTLLSPARVGGDFTAHVPRETNVTVSPGATIQGEQTTELRAASERERNKFATGGFYLAQLLRFAAAFVAGLVVLALVPGLRRVAVTSTSNGLLTGGIGLVALAAVPVIALIAMITVIGIPLALFGLMLYAACIYLAKVVLALLVGRWLIETRGSARHFAVALALGLALIIVVVNLPFIGGWTNFVLTILGLGLIVRFGWEKMRGTSERIEATA